MLSKEEKLKYGEALRQQVIKYQPRWKKNKKWKETKEEVHEQTLPPLTHNPIEQSSPIPASSTPKKYSSKDCKPKSTILSVKLEEEHLT